MPSLTFADWQQRAVTCVSKVAPLSRVSIAPRLGWPVRLHQPGGRAGAGQIASCDLADAERAVASARAAFEAGSWAKLAPAKRKAVLIRFADLLEANREELALLETLDMGKPIGDSLTVDIPGAARALRWSGEAIDKIYDEVAATPTTSWAWSPASRSAWWRPSCRGISADDGLLEARPGTGHRQLGGAQAVRSRR